MISSVVDPSFYSKPAGDLQAILVKLISQDHGLEMSKKQNLLAMLNTPDALEYLFVGAMGAAIMRALSSYLKMSSSAKTLLSLAGFGIGNIMYNIIKERKFSSFDTETGKVKIKL